MKGKIRAGVSAKIIEIETRHWRYRDFWAKNRDKNFTKCCEYFTI